MFKDFTKDFDFILDKLKNKENFAFSRFSDGELFILKNETLVLANDHFITGARTGKNIYTEEEHKAFYPDQHEKYQHKLVETFRHNQHNYFKGICTATDGHVGKENFNWMLDFHGGDHKNLTFANLLINANYKRFVHEIIPVLRNRKIIYVVNRLANTDNLPFAIQKKFLIGSNCMIDNYDTAALVRDYIKQNKLTDHIILCSAASLSNFIIHDCYKDNPNNTYLDIGSCLNPLLNLEGWKHTRGYLTSYWYGVNNHFGQQVDIWN
ncbi:MAG: hypothetical protein CL554_20185 [Algoriphagus sp.]|nr:hypothetical protein [Algoriphagus sp.]